MALRNVSYYGEVTPTNQIEQNLIWYLRYELLQLGAYYNITSGFLGYGGERLAKLRPSYQPEYKDYRFWAGLSHQWVWESGLTNTEAIVNQPIAISGVYVNNRFYPSTDTSGAYAHYIDYNRGGVVFDNPLSPNLNVFVNRTERAAFVYSAQSDEYRRIMYDHLRSMAPTPGSGIDAFAPEYKAFLPALFIAVEKSDAIPYELGNITNRTFFRVNFDIMAEHIGDLNTLRDLCHGLESYAVEFFDINRASKASGMYPLDYSGRLLAGAKTRPDILSSFPWKKACFSYPARDFVFPSVLPLHRARVSLDLEILL